MFENEIKFLNRKMNSRIIKWEARPHINKIMSHLVLEDEAKQIIAEFKRILGTRAGITFDSMFTMIQSKSQPPFRIVVSVDLLNDKFKNEIHGSSGSGGGGPSVNPTSTTLTTRRW